MPRDAVQLRPYMARTAASLNFSTTVYLRMDPYPMLIRSLIVDINSDETSHLQRHGLQTIVSLATSRYSTFTLQSHRRTSLPVLTW
jgi:hypothetical protein